MSLLDINNPILYSTMTTLAYNINKRYYKDLHYMWCTPYFGGDYQSPHFTVPPSSSPLEIYTQLKREIDGSDFHNTKIKLNKRGIKKGADIMFQNGNITEEEYQEIIAITKLATNEQFRPLLCIIPRIEALPFYKKVEIKAKANPLSYEYILAELPLSAFDIIKIG